MSFRARARSARGAQPQAAKIARVDLDEAVAEITGGRLPDITVEAAGYPDTLNAALRLVA